MLWYKNTLLALKTPALSAITGNFHGTSKGRKQSGDILLNIIPTTFLYQQLTYLAKPGTQPYLHKATKVQNQKGRNKLEVFTPA